MKITALLFIVSIGFSSCSSNDTKTSNIETVDPNDIRLNDIVHDTLSSEQIAKIAEIQSTFADVYSVSLDETIDDFKRDLNPDNEIAIWQNMAVAYKKYLTIKPQLDLDRKKEVFKLILSRSMMPENEAIVNAKLELLDEVEAKEVLSFYNDIPRAIKVSEK